MLLPTHAHQRLPQEERHKINFPFSSHTFCLPGRRSPGAERWVWGWVFPVGIISFPVSFSQGPGISNLQPTRGMFQTYFQTHAKEKV